MDTPTCACGCGQPTRKTTPSKPNRYIRGHATRHRAKPVAERFAEKTQAATDLSPNGMAGCIIWTGAVSAQGRGNLRYGDGNQLAHRVAWLLAYGKLPEQDLDHLCRRPLCVNPEHLEPVTHAENCRRGARAKITMAVADEIRALRMAGVPVHALMARYKLSDTTIYDVLNRKTWT